jgi:hypothetical protein
MCKAKKDSIIWEKTFKINDAGSGTSTPEIKSGVGDQSFPIHK